MAPEWSLSLRCNADEFALLTEEMGKQQQPFGSMLANWRGTSLIRPQRTSCLVLTRYYQVSNLTTICKMSWRSIEMFKFAYIFYDMAMVYVAANLCRGHFQMITYSPLNSTGICFGYFSLVNDALGNISIACEQQMNSIISKLFTVQRDRSVWLALLCNRLDGTLFNPLFTWHYYVQHAIHINAEFISPNCVPIISNDNNKI